VKSRSINNIEWLYHFRHKVAVKTAGIEEGLAVINFSGVSSRYKAEGESNGYLLALDLIDWGSVSYTAFLESPNEPGASSC
jgi:hypothetical protein